MSYKDFEESEETKNAKINADDAANQYFNYGDFNYSGQSGFDSIKESILNRPAFSYDVNGDALYQQYKDRYMKQGKVAMQDTMGQAAAMTGGYGNSYAASAGNQAYQQYVEGLNDVVPELYQLAYDKYNQEGQDLLNKYSLHSDAYSRERGEWESGKTDKYNEMLYWDGKYDDGRTYDRDVYDSDRTYDTNQQNAAKAEAQSKVATLIVAGEMVSPELMAAAGYDESYITALTKVYGPSANNGQGLELDKKEEDTVNSNFYKLGDKYLFNQQKTHVVDPEDKDQFIYTLADGSTRTVEKGHNPYNNEISPDAMTDGKYDPDKVFDNGYQPNNIGGTKIVKTGYMTKVNGVDQSVWQEKGDSSGTVYYWDGEANEYIPTTLKKLGLSTTSNNQEG